MIGFATYFELRNVPLILNEGSAPSFFVVVMECLISLEKEG
jgi:hypothetical protein